MIVVLSFFFSLVEIHKFAIKMGHGEIKADFFEDLNRELISRYLKSEDINEKCWWIDSG